MTMFLNGEASRAHASSDRCGKAALLLTESLIHGLVARSALSVAEAVDIVEIASDVQMAIDDEDCDEASGGPSSAELLRKIADSLAIDDPRKDGANLDAGEGSSGFPA